MGEESEIDRVRRQIALEKKARRILGIGAEADDSEIKKAFRRLAADNHPDKYPGDAEREKRFLVYLGAYEYLIKGGGGDELERVLKEYHPPDDLMENPWKYFAWWRRQFY